MKKFLVLCSVLLGFGVTGLLAEDATVTLPAPAAPSPAAPSAPAQGPAPAAGKKHHHKKHHKKKTSEATPPTPAPKS